MDNNTDLIKNNINEKKIIIPRFGTVSEEELKEEEDEIDSYGMKKYIKVNGKIIKTYGEIRPYIKSTRIARKFEDILHEDDFDYFYNWILRKELILKNKKI